jgi:hypothetical protein
MYLFFFPNKTGPYLDFSISAFDSRLYLSNFTRCFTHGVLDWLIFVLYSGYGKFRWEHWIQRLLVMRTALVMLTTMATIHGNGILLTVACFCFFYFFIFSVSRSFRHFTLSPQQGQTCTHTTHIWKKLFFKVSKFQQNLKRSTHHICGRDKWLPLCHSVLLSLQ